MVVLQYVALRITLPLRMAVEITEHLEEMRRRAPLPFIAARVRRARKDIAPKVSHDELGRRMGGVLRQTLIAWESARYRPSLELLTKYAEATDKSVEWFLDPDLDPSPFQEAA